MSDYKNKMPTKVDKAKLSSHEKFLLEDSKTILKKFFFLSIIFKVERPIEPVEPSIIIFFFIYFKTKVRNINPDGTPKSIPSILSRIPPCPGKRFPVSFFFAFLFKYEKNKSPSWQKIDVIIPVKINNVL